MATRGVIHSSSRRLRDGVDVSTPAGAETSRVPTEEGPAAAAAVGQAEAIFSASYRTREGPPGRERPRGVSAPAREKEQLRRSPLVLASAWAAPESAPGLAEAEHGSGAESPSPLPPPGLREELPPESGHVSMISSFVEAGEGRASRSSVSSSGSAEEIHSEALSAVATLTAQLAASRAEFARMAEQQAAILKRADEDRQRADADRQQIAQLLQLVAAAQHPTGGR
jgi:hypothetical protein